VSATVSHRRLHASNPQSIASIPTETNQRPATAGKLSDLSINSTGYDSTTLWSNICIRWLMFTFALCCTLVFTDRVVLRGLVSEKLIIQTTGIVSMNRRG
jgi:hypothetical protein